MRAFGHEDITMSGLGEPLEAASFDVAIETRATTGTLKELTRALRPGGMLVLKSRPVERVELDVLAILQRELTLRAARYAPFPDAIQALATSRLDVSGLLGETLRLEDYESAFARAGDAGAHKLFFDPNL